ncbi:aspartate/glutamate racemase family protein [Castellaniella sp.]|uniref:aspartate/glutamate racemase family protein n=1 Tax=Castellaniella sp. TaxID=1955812 RepID=UPI0035604A7C
MVLLGVLAGMGPLAGADFFRKLVEQTPSTADQDHIPTVIFSLPQIPDRNEALFGNGPDPFPALLDGVRRLVDAGAACIAMPCNSAHYWHARLAAQVDVPFIHIAEAVIEKLAKVGKTGDRIGILGTELTLRTRIYQDRLVQAGFLPVVPADMAQIMRGIRLIKAGRLGDARRLLKVEEENLLISGCSSVILACTEIPIALDIDHASPCSLDANRELANACIAWFGKSNRK